MRTTTMNTPPDGGGEEGREERRTGPSFLRIVAISICTTLVCQSLLMVRSLPLPPSLSFEATTATIASTIPAAATATTMTTPATATVNALDVPIGPAINLPSIQQDEEEQKALQRGIYGGTGDKQHLGGFTDIDMHGISPAVWKHVVANWTVQSVVDVGCGRGTSTSWFVTHGLRTECVEGSHDALAQSMVPDPSILTEHDFSRGPWWPAQTFDAVWSVEFLEHVGVPYHYNYMATFRKAAILLVTSSRWGGWHHVEVHKDDWWIQKYAMYGFIYDEKLTNEIRGVARAERNAATIFPPKNATYNAQHVWTTMKVFLNPAVGGLPQHGHLFGELGCYDGRKKGTRACSGERHETPLDPAYLPLPLTNEQDQAWYDIVKANINQ